MKKITRFVALGLSMAMLAGVLSGCNDTNTADFKEEKKNVKPVIENTDFDLVSNGESEYKIVLPAEPSSNETFAANELQYFIMEATGAKLEIVNETADIESDKCLFVGNVDAARDIKPTYEDVKQNGYIIKTVEDDCFLIGYTEYGTRNAIYDFLYYVFDYECYAIDEVVLTCMDSVKLPAFDVTELPSFDWREVTGGEAIYNEQLAYRMRFNTTEEIFVMGHLVHVSMEIIDPFVYDFTSDKYKDWYSEAMWNGVYDASEVKYPAQLCYSNDEMREEYTKNLIEMIKDSSAGNMLIGIEDNLSWCTCDKCVANKEKYGTDAATMIQFVNQVQADVDAWYAESRPDRQTMRLVFFAYYSTVNPPVTYDRTTGTYTPVDDSVVVNDNSAIMFAPITARYDIPFTANNADDITNPHGQALGWSSVSRDMFAWTYCLYPAQGFLCFDSFEVMQQNYRLLAEHGTEMILDQGNSYQMKDTGWGRARTYIMSKLQWDTELDMGELLDDFFANYFDVAGDTMQSLFDDQRDWIANIYANIGGTGLISDDLVAQEYWQYNQLADYMDRIEQAFEEIKPIEEKDPERYAVLYDRILLESIQFRYLLIQLYPTEYTASELYDAKLEFREDFERLGMTSFRENGTIDILWSEWGID